MRHRIVVPPVAKQYVGVMIAFSLIRSRTCTTAQPSEEHATKHSDVLFALLHTDRRDDVLRVVAVLREIVGASALVDDEVELALHDGARDESLLLKPAARYPVHVDADAVRRPEFGR